MKFALVASLIMLAGTLVGAGGGFFFWSAKDLAGLNKRLAADMQGKPGRSEDLLKIGNHRSLFSRVTADGIAEVHENFSDNFICVGGEATLRLGGKLVDEKLTAPGEHRASSIEGGKDYVMKPGSMAHIPAGTPHQLLVKGEFLNFVTKVGEKGPRPASQIAVFSHADLMAWEPKLKAKLAGKTAASEKLADWGTHYISIVYRNADGAPEVHENEVDYYWIQSGHATLVAGSETVHMGPGEIAHIPVKMDHQAKTAGPLVYAVLKVVE
jgi:mannose-6-phosphate isomerase-like protein (cupin superfamily)